MIFWFNLALLVSLACVTQSVSVAKCTPRDSPVLRTSHGDLAGACQFIQVGDQKNDLSGNVYSWLGVPYAEAPINQNRFKPPVELKSWSGQRNATKLANACISETPDQPQLQANQSRHSQQFAGFSMWRSSSRQSLTFSEDCLYLNAYLPASAYLKVPIHYGDQRPPIMVFFHGGNTVFGSSSLDVYDPRAFVAATETIVVTVNYRLGIFGFLSLDGEFEGNQAILDQHAALRWVKNNAEALGGDPTRITIVGQDAGAVLAGYHLFFPSSWPLFKNMILQSGTPLLTALQPISKLEANRRAREVLKYVGCINQTEAKNSEVAECARRSVHIGEAAKNFYQHLLSNKKKANLYLQTFFPPVLDGHVITHEPLELLKSGQFKRCPLLLGFTADEGSSIIAQSGLMGSKTYEFKKQQIINHSALSSFIKEYFSFFPTYPRESNKLFLNSILHEYTKIINADDASLSSTSHLIKPNYFHTLSKMLGDEAFVCPAYRLADFYSKEKQNVYLYLYAHRISSTPWPSWYGAVHGDELAMTFGMPLAAKHHFAGSTSTNPWSNPKHVYSNSERALSLEIMNYWAEFARRDSPKSNQANTKAWPEFRQTDVGDLWGQYLILKTNGTKVGRGFSIEQCQFWNSHIPSIIEQQDTTEQSQSRLLFAAQQDQSCSAGSMFSLLANKSILSLILAVFVAVIQSELLRL